MNNIDRVEFTLRVMAERGRENIEKTNRYLSLSILGELTREAQEMGLYDMPPGPRPNAISPLDARLERAHAS